MSNSSGSVYVLTNPSFDYLKVGATTGSPFERCKQLNASSSAPTPFSLYYYHYFTDVFGAEAEIHKRLKAFRVNPGKEFFRIGVDKAVAALTKLAEDNHENGNYCGSVGALPSTYQFAGHDDPSTPMAELYASFKPSDDPYLNPDEIKQCRALQRQLQY